MNGLHLLCCTSSFSHTKFVLAFIFVLKMHTIRQENCPFFTKSLFYSEDVKLWTQVKLSDVSCAEPFCTNITIRILTTKDNCWFAVWWGCHLFANIILLILIISLACIRHTLHKMEKGVVTLQWFGYHHSEICHNPCMLFVDCTHCHGVKICLAA